MKESRIRTFIFSILFPLIIGMISAAISSKGMALYATMEKPPLSPPAWTFSVVWTILYIMMGLASYFILTSNSSDKYMAFILYVIQLIFNFWWSILFFHWNMYLLSLLCLIIMWAIVSFCTYKFFSIDKVSGWLMVPYIFWLTFAAYLNLGAYILSLR